MSYPARAEGLVNSIFNDADDIAILANTLTQAETLTYSLERAAAGIDLHVNAHKMEYICFNQTGDISTLGGNIAYSCADSCMHKES